MTQDATQHETARPTEVVELEPRAPHDGLTFDELAQRYNFLNISSFAHVMANLIVAEIKRRSGPVRVLDVGCGRGLGRRVDYQWTIRNMAAEYWGLEPDESIKPPPGLFDHYQHALMETARLPQDSFDVIYSTMVMEHVVDPDAFMQAVYRCLKPGGSYLFLTPNAHSLASTLTRILHKLHLEELVLRLIKGKQTVESYHYPVQYRFNSPHVINACAHRLGFAEPQYVFIEGKGGSNYYPGPLKLIYHARLLHHKIIQNPRQLATMICRLTRPA